MCQETGTGTPISATPPPRSLKVGTSISFNYGACLPLVPSHRRSLFFSLESVLPTNCATATKTSFAMDVDAAAQAAAAAAAMQAAIMAAVHAAITEIWTLYGIGSTLIACRLFVRMKMVGFRGLQPDDYIALWVFVSIHRPTNIIFIPTYADNFVLDRLHVRFRCRSRIDPRRRRQAYVTTQPAGSHQPTQVRLRIVRVWHEAIPGGRDVIHGGSLVTEAMHGLLLPPPRAWPLVGEADPAAHGRNLRYRSRRHHHRLHHLCACCQAVADLARSRTYVSKYFTLPFAVRLTRNLSSPLCATEPLGNDYRPVSQPGDGSMYFEPAHPSSGQDANKHSPQDRSGFPLWSWRIHHDRRHPSYCVHLRRKFSFLRSPPATADLGPQVC